MIRAIILNDDELVRGEMGRTSENSPPIYCNNHATLWHSCCLVVAVQLAGMR
jgi:hypothetical protein